MTRQRILRHLPPLLAITAAIVLLIATLRGVRTSGVVLTALAVLALTIPVLLAGRGAALRAARCERLGERTATRRTNSGSVAVVPADLRHEARATAEHIEELSRGEIVTAYLRDVAATLGADEVVFWRWRGEAEDMRPVAWASNRRDGPAAIPDPQWLPQARWSAQSGAGHLDDAPTAPRFAAWPVGRDHAIVGVLGAWSGAGFSQDRAQSREWMRRHAAQLATLNALLDGRRRTERQLRNAEALLRAAIATQSSSSAESVAGAIITAALELTAAKRAAVVRWDAASQSGVVVAISDGFPLRPGFRVTESSLVSTWCGLGQMVVKEDARDLAVDVPVLGEGEPRRGIGAIGLLPLIRGERGVIGALLVEGERQGDLLTSEMRYLRQLADMGSGTLEVSWAAEAEALRARTDQLTGLDNRRHFDEQLGQVLAEADRYGTPASLIVADVDFFKRVNDVHGHDAGDAVLKAVAATFRDAMRSVDVCARYGGEELAILMRHTDLDGALEVAERLRRTIESRPVRYKGKEIPVTASFGVATYPICANARDSFFPAADAALYRAKGEGRNRVKAANVLRAVRTA